VASTDHPEDDDEPTIHYLVDDITESTSCKLHVKVVNITMKVAVGYALPIGPDLTYHAVRFHMAMLLPGWMKLWADLSS
jgi:hypothetical protein